MTLHALLLVFACVFELVAIFPVATRINLVAAGLFCYFLSLLL